MARLCDCWSPWLSWCAVVCRGADGLKGASIVSVGCCAFSSFAIAKDGKVYGWGMNNYGQLGWEVPTEKGRAGDGFYAPREITSLSHKGVACIKGGEHHAIALTSSGEVRTRACTLRDASSLCTCQPSAHKLGYAVYAPGWTRSPLSRNLKCVTAQGNTEHPCVAVCSLESKGVVQICADDSNKYPDKYLLRELSADLCASTQ